MKKTIILLFSIAFAHAVCAQDTATNVQQDFFSFQLVQHVGLNDWSSMGYAKRGFPDKGLTELRTTMTVTGKYWGCFMDMGIGVMGGPKLNASDITQMPMPNSGTQYYLRDVITEQGMTGASVHFKMAAGFTGNIPINEDLMLKPYVGIGFITMPQRKYEVLLKEAGSNMEYRTSYIWNCENDAYGNGNASGDRTTPGYLNLRLNLKYKVSEKTNLLVGLEYTNFLTGMDFFAHYSNVFNANIERNISVVGNRMNMLGLSVGLSF
ncbi:MAG: hypothetical protein LBU91_07125 [Bacteroidales bacterium]|jgi:hypothetical protein|nr:hypothetical protein [Bacteroidales bacterium]